MSWWDTYLSNGTSEITVEKLNELARRVPPPRDHIRYFVHPAEYERMKQRFGAPPEAFHPLIGVPVYALEEVNMTKFQKAVAVAKVILKAAPTYLAIAAAIIPILVDEVAPVLPGGWASALTVVAVKAAAILGAAIAVIRRVTPVVKEQRGLL